MLNSCASILLKQWAHLRGQGPRCMPDIHALIMRFMSEHSVEP